jgi:hypothetical protein
LLFCPKAAEALSATLIGAGKGTGYLAPNLLYTIGLSSS